MKKLCLSFLLLTCFNLFSGIKNQDDYDKLLNLDWEDRPHVVAGMLFKDVDEIVQLSRSYEVKKENIELVKKLSQEQQIKLLVNWIVEELERKKYFWISRKLIDTWTIRELDTYIEMPEGYILLEPVRYYFDCFDQNNSDLSSKVKNFINTDVSLFILFNIINNSFVTNMNMKNIKDGLHFVLPKDLIKENNIFTGIKNFADVVECAFWYSPVGNLVKEFKDYDQFQKIVVLAYFLHSLFSFRLFEALSKKFFIDADLSNQEKLIMKLNDFDFYYGSEIIKVKNLNVLKDGYAPLHRVVLDGNLDEVVGIINIGADVNLQDSYGRTPLWWAAERDNTEIVKILLDVGAKVDVKSQGGWTPLHVAANDGNISSVKLLLAALASVDIKDDEGETPLDAARKMELKEKKRDYFLVIDALSKTI